MTSTQDIKKSDKVFTFALIGAMVEITQSESVDVKIVTDKDFQGSIQEAYADLGKEASVYNKIITIEDSAKNTDIFMYRTTFNLPFKIFAQNNLFNYFMYRKNMKDSICVNRSLKNFPETDFLELLMENNINIVTKNSIKGRECLEVFGDMKSLPNKILILRKETDNGYYCGFSFDTKPIPICSDELLAEMYETERKAL